jgi:hypothetical protein
MVHAAAKYSLTSWVRDTFKCILHAVDYMIITRKIEVFVCEDDKDLRRSYYEKLYDNRNNAVAIANMGIAHLFMLDNTTPYLSEENRETLEYLGCKGQKATKQNAPYVAVSEKFKGKVDMNMVTCILQNASKMYQDDRKQGMWNRSLRSYKANMPIPFKSCQYKNIRFADYQDNDGKTHNGCFFTLIGVPFQCKFGRDRSGNRLIVERVVKGEYKMCTSSLKFEKNKIFLLLCVDIPKQDVKVDEKKQLFAFLGVLNPIVCTTDVKAYKEYDSGFKVFEIGTKEEFNYRRRQIQEAVKRCQINNKYSAGGKGRKKKCQAIERWHEKENNYVDTKLHAYSRILVGMAIKHGCGTIVLMNQAHREEKAKEDNQKGDSFVLRNWSYYGLKEKISYKCKMTGIKLQIEK